MSVVVTAWNTGLIIGPAMGGKLFVWPLCKCSVVVSCLINVISLL